jgi:hypothetical protein
MKELATNLPTMTYILMFCVLGLFFSPESNNKSWGQVAAAPANAVGFYRMSKPAHGEDASVCGDELSRVEVQFRQHPMRST